MPFLIGEYDTFVLINNKFVHRSVLMNMNDMDSFVPDGIDWKNFLFKGEVYENADGDNLLFKKAGFIPIVEDISLQEKVLSAAVLYVYRDGDIICSLDAEYLVELDVDYISELVATNVENLDCNVVVSFQTIAPISRDEEKRFEACFQITFV